MTSFNLCVDAWTTWPSGRRSWIIWSDIIRATRTHDGILVGAGPRATQSFASRRPRLRGYRWKGLCDARRRQDHGPARVGTSYPAPSRIGDRRIRHSGGDRSDTERGGCAPMIAPTLRLLVCYGLVIPLLTLLPLFGTGRFLPALAGCLVFVMAALIDCILAGVRSRTITVEVPALVRMTKGREGLIAIDVHNSRTSQTIVRLGLPFPEEIHSPHDDLTARLPERESSMAVAWPCTPLRRGRFLIDGCYGETRSILGLWTFRRRHDGACGDPRLSRSGRGREAHPCTLPQSRHPRAPCAPPTGQGKRIRETARLCAG